MTRPMLKRKKGYPLMRPLPDTVYILPHHGIRICTVLKAGSSSIVEAVLQSLGMPYDDREGSWTNAFWMPPTRRTKFAGMPAFGVVRNPVDRFLSAYAWRRGTGQGPHNKGWDCASTVDEYLDICGLGSEGRRRHGIADDPDFMLQSPSLVPVEKPWRFDRLRKWWACVRAASARPLPDLPHRNASTVAKPVLTDAQVARIRSIYSRDVELYERGL